MCTVSDNVFWIVGSEEFFSTDLEESESSSHSDWESLGEIEEGSKGVNYSPVEPCAASTVNANVSKVSVINFQNLFIKREFKWKEALLLRSFAVDDCCVNNIS
jgi:hypothetical protein